MEPVQDDAGKASTTANGADVAPANDSPAATPAPAETSSRRDYIATALEGYKPAEPAAAKPADTPLPTAAPTPPAAPAPMVDPATGRVMEPMKAPNSWTPALREKWGTIDPTVQKFLIDRDRDMAIQLQNVAEARKFHKEFNEVFAPMQELMTQNKWQGTPLQVLKNNLELAVALNTGSPQQKAQIFFNLIRHFQPDSQTLQALFSGQPANVPPMTPPQARPAPAGEQPDREALLQEARAEEALKAFAADEANEWFADVRVQMGQIINAGLVDTSKPFTEQLKDAYDLAVTRHPEIAQIMAARTPAAPAAPAAQPRDEAGRFAQAPAPTPVRSVKPSLGSGRPSSAPKRYGTNSRQAALEAYEELMAASR
jgi:hypothetical protein